MNDSYFSLSKTLKFLNSKPIYFWGILFLLNLILRVSSLYTDFLDVDESQFAGFAHVLMDHGIPYVDSLDTKPLGIYLFYWFCFKLFGRFSMIGVHFATIVWIYISSYYLYRCFALFQKKLEGRLAALFFIIFSTTFIPKYIATSINSIMVLYLIFSVYLVFVAELRKKLSYDLIAGLVLGLGFLFKYQAGIQTVLFFIYAMPIWKFRKKDKGYNSQKFAIRVLFFGLGFVIPFLFHALALHVVGAWNDFIEWSIKGSGHYIQAGGQTISFFESFATRVFPYILSTLILWVLAFRKGVRHFFDSHDQVYSLKMILWFFLSLIPVSISGRYYAHYFYQLLPALCALAAMNAASFLKHPEQIRSFQWRSVFAFILIPVIFFWGLRLDYQCFLKKFPDDDIYLQKKVGLRLKKMGDPKDYLHVWGFATGIYFYSEMKANSRFLWNDWMTGRVPGPKSSRKGVQDQKFSYPLAWEKFWQDMKKRPPKFFVDTSPANIHGYKDYPLQKYPKLFQYLSKNYKKIEEVEKVVIYRLKD